MSRRSIPLLICSALLGASCVSTHSGVTTQHHSADTGTRRSLPAASTVPATRPPRATPTSAQTDVVATTTAPTPAPTRPSPVPATVARRTPGTTIPAADRPDRPMEVLSGVINFGGEHVAKSYDGFLTAAIKDIQQFWAAEMPKLYDERFRPLRGGIFAAYPERESRIPGCGAPSTPYDDIEGNAFYCSIGDFVAYDDSLLIPSMVKKFGVAAVGVVFAHEFGHAVQERAGEINQDTIYKEQQADCFAGAWAARAARGEIKAFRFGDRDVRAGLIAMISVADPVQLSGSTGGDAHGTGFDRVGAFQEGFTSGASACKSYFTSPRPLVDVRFTIDANNGDLPLDDFVKIIPQVFDYRAEQVLTQLRATGFRPPAVQLYTDAGEVGNCPELAAAANKTAVWCSATNTIALNEQAADRGIATVGDLNPGYLVGIAYAEAMQRFLKSTLSGEARQLANDCVFGAMTRLLINRDTTPVNPPPSADTVAVSLSAGDLDEAVVTAIKIADQSADADVMGTAFDKVAAFRSGVNDGVSACKLNS